MSTVTEIAIDVAKSLIALRHEPRYTRYEVRAIFAKSGPEGTEVEMDSLPLGNPVDDGWMMKLASDKGMAFIGYAVYGSIRHEAHHVLGDELKYGTAKVISNLLNKFYSTEKCKHGN